MEKEMKLGTYRHFKGDLYEVLHVARDSENRERYWVVYRSHKTGEVWVRSLEMFLEHVERDGYAGPRFVYVG